MLDSQFLLFLPRIGAALLLVMVAAIISYWHQLDLEKNIVIAVSRAFIQLIAIGYALNLLFNSTHRFWIVIIVGVMVLIAGQTAGNRAWRIRHSKQIATLAIGISTTLVVLTLITLNVFPLEPRFIIPISGMIIGNAMTATGLTLAHLQDNIQMQRQQIEAALSLGATSRQASQSILQNALRNGMAPIIDKTKTVGLISLPGAMTGMILAGASPFEAIQLQIVVMYMLVGAVAFASLAAVFFALPSCFTSEHQLSL